MNTSKVAVVTGSSSGIGRAIAIHLADAGYDVLLHGNLNLIGLNETARLIADIRGKSSVRICTADIRDRFACQRFVETAFAWQGRVDAWVNNAGADVLTGSASKLPFEDRLQLLLDVDVSATIRLSRLVAAKWLANGVLPSQPSVVNIGWDQANLGMEGEPGQLFGTCKTAVEAFTRSFALSVGPTIRANCVAPGWIQTAWGEQSASGFWHERAESESIMQRWGTPDDVAAAVQWLVSPRAQFINGQVIPVNGGRRFYPSENKTR
ncbi:MAG: SDR family oxidoreductase [Aureliella sp.]